MCEFPMFCHQPPMSAINLQILKKKPMGVLRNNLTIGYLQLKIRLAIFIQPCPVR